VPRKSRTPLKRAPLRNPGQSIEERISELLDDRVLAPLVMVLFLCVLSGLEWLQSITHAPPQPVLPTVLALMGVGFVMRRLVVVRREIKRLRLGLDGEKAVAQYLERHRGEGWRLFNDLPGAGFNVDHVLVTPQGVFAIETKTISKPVRGEAKITYDGEQVLVNGLAPERNPLVQARAARDWIRSILEDTTDRTFPVRAVVLFPGWYVTRTGSRRKSDVWVLNEKALPAFIEHEESVVASEDVALVASRLEDHIVRWKP
jgi:hypothetical protein